MAKSKLTKDQTGKLTWKPIRTRPPAGSQGPTKYMNRLRWDEKAKMYTVVDLPKKRIKKD